MSDMGRLRWGNIDVEFDATVFAVQDVEAAVRGVEARLGGFGDRVPSGTMILLSRHAFSGDYVAAYQVGAGAPREVAKRAWTARRAVNKLLEDLASRISGEISPLRPKR